MAIGYRSGYLRKKIGDMVMFVNQNVNGKVKQVARAYTAEVKNPKTARQSNQRSLFVSAKNFRRGFESLLNHSWQGKKYGVQSLNRFSQLVLANKGANYPGFFLQPKNSQKFIPQPWPLSTGSVISPFGSASFEGNAAVISIAVTATMVAATTYGDFCSKLIAANPSLHDGDMITVCAVVDIDSNTSSVVATTHRFVPVYDRIVLDVNSTAAVSGGQIMTENNAFQLMFDDSGPVVAILCAAFASGSIVGCSIIVSRLGENTTTWQRSTAIMAVASAVEDAFNDTEYVNNCIATFMDESMLTSDWYLNQVGQDTSNPGGGIANSYEKGSVTLANSQTLANALIATIGGVRKPVAGGSGASKACVKYGTEGWQYTPASDLLPAATEAWTIGEFNAAFPEVTITLVETP